jgi:hypothetical protein
MNDMSAPFTNCPESELAGLLCADRVESRVGHFSLRSEFARSLNLGNIRPKSGDPCCAEITEGAMQFVSRWLSHH